tara:strand:+ start:121 stop:510 length:390 start_codon:yes stop_codon:yes gene_type:complete
MINQLFRKMVTLDDLHKILSCFNLQGLNDARIFTKYDLLLYKTIEKMKVLLPMLHMYYLPCKAKLYLHNLTIRKCITILRQVIRLYEYNLESNERYISKKKCVAYRMYPMGKSNIPLYINNKSTLITFD